MKKYKSHQKTKLPKQQKYPALRKKFTLNVPIRPSILNKKVDPDIILENILKLCDEAKNNKNGR